MPLTGDLRKSLESELDKIILRLPSFFSYEDAEFKKVWKCDNVTDFSYGWTVGEMMGYLRGYYHFLGMGQAPSVEDEVEIFEIVLSRAPAIKEKYKGIADLK